MAKSSVESPAAAGDDREPQRRAPSVDLRDPVVAGVLAWAIPGAGHWYQGRRTKAVLFFVCIFSTFFYGLWLGDGRVVYASWGETQEEKRLPYVCQLGTGVVALPALIQARNYGDATYRAEMQKKEDADERTFGDWFMAPPVLIMHLKTGRRMDEQDFLNYTLNRRFELGTIYTMIAGLLNVLIIFDALGGPAYGAGTARHPPAGPKEEEAPPEKPSTAPS